MKKQSVKLQGRAPLDKLVANELTVQNLSNKADQYLLYSKTTSRKKKKSAHLA